MRNYLQDRIRGSLVGGAIGDALGYPVEFVNSYSGIQSRYGERGITRLDIRQYSPGRDVQKDKAVVSDDTQMTLFTALGEGWVGEEALAIGLYCALKYLDNFEEAMISSVNHVGDSDSTGAVTGNILGAAIGYDAIPHFYNDDVELLDVILHMADDLYLGEVTKYHKQ